MSRINNLIIAGILLLGMQVSMVRAEEAAPKPVPSPAALEANPTLPGLVYHPEGDAIVVRNGTRWDNRPLYCNARKMVVYAGEMPGLSCELGKLRVGIRRGDVCLQFDQFNERVMRYRPGRMEWEVREPKLPGLTVMMTATTLAKGDGFTVRVMSKGAKAGDELQWIILNEKPAVVAGGFKTAKAVVSLSGNAGESLALPLSDDVPRDFAMAGAPEPLPATSAFEEGLARVEKLGRQVVVETPDPYFNAGIGASCAAMYGMYIEPWFSHGGSNWRVCYPGWRIMDGVTAYGWHDLVANAMKYHGDRQVANSPNVKAEADGYGCQQSSQSRYYGVGKVNTAGMYDMQTQFFDQCVRDWRATGNAAFEKRLLPMLELHLQWAKDCFDPDGDGLYESYINTWPTDSVWYNGGGTVEQSAYICYQSRAAAEMCRRAGRSADADKYGAEADKIHKALDGILWLRDKGQYAAYIEQGGLKRVHDDAWIYSQHLPIEAGMSTPLQAWQAMYYTDWAMEKYRFPYGGEMRQTSNWIPNEWSTRELFAGDNFAMALGYYLAGQGDDGWELLRGAMLESMYGDPEPKAGYHFLGGGNFSPNFISPGGLSHPTSAIDFNDITSMFCRTVVEGLFGYRPDYPNGVVTVAPGLPSAWDHASIKTPDYSFAFMRDGAVDGYAVELTKPAKISLRIPILAEKVKSVNVNGVKSKWNIEPWAGCGMLVLDLPESAKVDIEINLSGRVPQGKAIAVAKKVGEEKRIANAIDPQGCLGAHAKPGQHMAFAKVERGNVPYLQVYKVTVSDPEGDARRAAKLLRAPQADAKWKQVPLTGVLNGDVRTIFQQKYLSPRPATVSCRIGYDGWSAWTFPHWRIPAPNVKLSKPGEAVTTSNGVPFGVIGAATNIAFTSRWDNWPKSVTAPVNAAGEAVWLLVCGSSNPMQGRIANAVLRFKYVDGQEEQLELVPPLNFWSLCGFGRTDYDLKRDAFALPKEPPAQIQLGDNCRAMVYGWKLRAGVVLKEVTLETLSQEVVIGLMGLSLMN
jgi:hypothetical protein